jgi:hypothetical protein
MYDGFTVELPRVVLATVVTEPVLNESTADFCTVAQRKANACRLTGPNTRMTDFRDRLPDGRYRLSLIDGNPSRHKSPPQGQLPSGWHANDSVPHHPPSANV